MKTDLLVTPFDIPQSPFIPGTNIQYAYDSTSLGYLKTCAKLYQYVMIDGWAEREDSIHLRFGIEVHTGFEQYEKLRADGADHDEAVHIVVHDALKRTIDFHPDEDTRTGKYKNRWSLVRTLIWTLDHFEGDTVKTLILDDGRPAVELSFRFELDYGPGGQRDFKYMICGHLDRVVEFGGDLYVMDHKTTTMTPGQYYFNQFEPNNQMTLYTLASQVVLGAPVKGVIINALQLLVEATKPQRGFTYRTQDQLNEWLEDLHVWFAMAEGFAISGRWPMNDTACDKFGGCRFREVCSKSAHARPAFLKAKFDQLPEDERWNPLKAR